MSVQPATPPGSGSVLERRGLLFTPGARLGWVFRDRRQLATPFPEPPPGPQAFQASAQAQIATAEATYRKVKRWAGTPSLIVVVLLLLLAGCAKAINGQANTGATVLGALILGGPGLMATGVAWRKREQARTLQPDQQYQQAFSAWQQRANAYEQGEAARLEHVPEWGSADPPTRRVDVFGGNLWGWQALLTTHGTSILASRPLLVMDLTGERASTELTATAEAAGVPANVYLLPTCLARSGPLSTLSAAQLADALAEAIHAGTPGGARTDRAVDVRVLEQLAGALGSDVTPARLAAAAQAALGHPSTAGLLTAREEALIGGELFPSTYRQQIEPNLIRLDAFLADLARYTDDAGTVKAGSPAYYTCVAIDSGARSARAEVLTALAIQWLTVQVTASSAAVPAVIIAGADEITRPHLERLSDACERRGIPLTLLFRHLREDGLAMLGGGTAAFMRLGNHTEAEQAASFIGRQHTFVLSQLTATLGGNETHTRTDTESYGITDTINVTSTTGWQESWDTSRTSSGGLTRSRSTGTSRNWSTALSWANGTNWSDATTQQRVYEYAVEPTVLQNLPDHALLVISRDNAGSRLQPVECDPAIITLPRVSITPLGPAPARAEIAAPPPGGWPAWTGQPAYLPQPQLPPPSRDQWRQSAPPHSPGEAPPAPPGPPRPGPSPLSALLARPVADHSTMPPHQGRMPRRPRGAGSTAGLRPPPTRIIRIPVTSRARQRDRCAVRQSPWGAPPASWLARHPAPPPAG